MGSRTQQATVSGARWRALLTRPGSEAASSLTWRLCGNQGDPTPGAQGVRVLGQVLKARKRI
jgi:hypothetical protein